MEKEKRLSLCIPLVLALFIVLSCPGIAQAAVSLNVRPGLNGLYKTEQPVPLTIVIDNPGPEFAGCIEVRPYNPRQSDSDLNQTVYVSGPYSSFNGRYRTAVKVPGQSRQELRLVVPGEVVASLPVVELVSDEVVLAKAGVEGTSVSGGQIVLALSEEIVGGGLQSSVSEQRNSSINLKYLPPQSLPSGLEELNILDIIMVDPVAVSGLTASQAKAIKEWVYLGGRLVLLGGAGASEGAPFADLTPVRPTGEKLVDGSLKGLRTGGPLSVVSGELIAGEIVLADNGVTVMAQREVGHGQVFYCGAVPANLGKGATGVWSFLAGLSPGLSILEDSSFLRYIPLEKRPYLQNQQNLVDASSYIPQLKGPAVKWLMGLWMVYLLIVGPLLYLILRRFDRRDWAWGLIPAGALLAAVGFYMLAPFHRMPGQLIQTLTTVEILSPQLAEVKAGATVVTSKKGDLAVRGVEGMMVIPSQNMYGPVNDQSTLINQQDNCYQVDFHEVPFSGARQVAVAGIQRNRGSIEGKMYLEGSKLKGELINRTGLDLQDVRLAWGRRVIEVAEWPTDGSLTIEETVATLKTVANSDWFGPWRPDDPYYRERRMLNNPLISSVVVETREVSVRATGWNAGLPETVQFIGWHKGSPGLLTVQGPERVTQEYGLVLLTQDLPVEMVPGEISLPAGSITPLSGKGIELGPEGMILYENSGNLTYDLKSLEKKYNFKITGLSFPAWAATEQYS
ncbi:MAG: hypothetical protein GX755_03755, partial [Syntrophomonadaceae bacterium]|nr:hypothetical protein [Syntrophomonadaceae bacterium]